MLAGVSDQIPPPPPPPSAGPPPPPPGSFGGATPPPPPPPYGAAPTPVAAPGGSLPPTAGGSRGLATAAIVLFWVTAAAAAFAVIALFNRRAAWQDVVDGDAGLSGLSKLSDADDLVSAANVVTFLAALASVIVVSIWSLRVGRRARARGATDVSPGLLCGSWYIPYASAIIPFIQLRRIARHDGRPRGMVSAWQGLLIAGWVLGTAVGGLEPGEDDVFNEVDDLTDQLTTQSVVGVLALVVLVAMAFVAMRAVRDLDTHT
jgi:hypothetical protein